MYYHYYDYMYTPIPVILTHCELRWGTFLASKLVFHAAGVLSTTTLQYNKLQLLLMLGWHINAIMEPRVYQWCSTNCLALKVYFTPNSSPCVCRMLYDGWTPT